MKDARNRQAGWLPIIATTVAAIALILGMAQGCGSCSGSNGTDSGAGTNDSGTDTAIATDSGPGTDAGPKLSQCERICDLVAMCGIPLGGECGAFCARFDGDVLMCLEQAAGAGDCAGALSCIVNAPPPPECDPLCTWADMSCTLPAGICDGACAIVNDETRSCAADAMTNMDCDLFTGCLIDPATARTCSDICSFAVDDCGQMIPFGTPGCIAACGSGLVPEVVIACYQVSSLLNSCTAAEVCGSLIGVPPPATDSGVTDAGGGTDAGGTDSGGTDSGGADSGP